jgi:hypothetical protein
MVYSSLVVLRTVHKKTRVFLKFWIIFFCIQVCPIELKTLNEHTSQPRERSTRKDERKENTEEEKHIIIQVKRQVEFI